MDDVDDGGAIIATDEEVSDKEACTIDPTVIRRKVPPSEISHADAKLLAPPSSYVWRRHTTGHWCGKLPPHGEISRSWTKHGEREAVLGLIRELWTQHGMIGDACPIEGLFG